MPSLVSWVHSPTAMLNLALNLIEGVRLSTYFSSNSRHYLDGLYPIRQWLNGLEIGNAAFAHFICRTIPMQCPFERDICLFGCTIAHIPPLCKLNPLYEEVVSLRFRALCYLADECGEDVGCYCWGYNLLVRLLRWLIRVPIAIPIRQPVISW